MTALGDTGLQAGFALPEQRLGYDTWQLGCTARTIADDIALASDPIVLCETSSVISDVIEALQDRQREIAARVDALYFGEPMIGAA